MAAPPRFKSFRMEEYPGAPSWLQVLLPKLNESVGGLVNAISGRLTRKENFQSFEKLDYAFTTKPVAEETWPLRLTNALPFRPNHCILTKLVRDDRAAIVSPFCFTWDCNASGQLQFWVQGLDASTGYKMNLVVE